jgi:catecholate siderophore receptor
LRSFAAINSSDERAEIYSGRKVTAVAGLIAVASVTGAEAQQTNLPPVNVDAPVARPRPAASKPTLDQVRARDALRRAARRNQPTQAPVPFPNAGQLSPDRNPYADAAAPYKVDHLQASGKFPEPLLNTPKSVTVLSKEVLEDKNATTLKQAILSTAGVTLGTGEGGNAFGDRFFFAASTRATTSSSTGCATPASACAKTSSPSRSKSCAGRPRPLPAAAPPAARSIS